MQVSLGQSRSARSHRRVESMATWILPSSTTDGKDIHRTRHDAAKRKKRIRAENYAKYANEAEGQGEFARNGQIAINRHGSIPFPADQRHGSAFAPASPRQPAQAGQSTHRQFAGKLEAPPARGLQLRPRRTGVADQRDRGGLRGETLNRYSSCATPS